MKPSALFPCAYALLSIALLTGCDKTVEPTPPSVRTYTYSVLSGSGAAVQGAVVRIQTENGTFAGSTDGSGKCRLDIPNDVSLPTYVVTTIDHSQIIPEARTVPGGVNQSVSATIQCTGLPNRVYVRDANLHHLGNDRYDGSANSQLQIRSQGISQSYSFHLDQAPAQMPYLRIFARGIEHPTRIKINGTTTNTLGNSASSGDLSLYKFKLSGTPSSLLHAGTNTLIIETAPFDPNSDPYDDIEYCAVALYYQ